MKKFIIIIGLLCLPFFVAAQWSVNLSGESGIAIETMRQTIQIPPDNTEKPYSNYGVLGYSFSAGIEVQHFFTSRIGMSTGLGFFFAKSPNENLITLSPQKKWHSESINIPVSFLWALGSSHRSSVRLGFSAHFNLLQKSSDYESLNT